MRAGCLRLARTARERGSPHQGLRGIRPWPFPRDARCVPRCGPRRNIGKRGSVKVAEDSRQGASLLHEASGRFDILPGLFAVCGLVQGQFE